MKESELLHSKVFFKVLRKIPGTSISNCDFFLKFIISVGGSHCDYLPLVPINLATPLAANKLYALYIFINLQRSRLP
jgi:hypothetical protein